MFHFFQLSLVLNWKIAVYLHATFLTQKRCTQYKKPLSDKKGV